LNSRRTAKSASKFSGSGRHELPDGTRASEARDVVTVPVDTAFDFVDDDIVGYCCASD